MEIQLRCREVGFDCSGELRAKDSDELLAMAAAHVRQAHGITEPTTDLIDRVLAAARAVDSPAGAEG